MQTWKLRPTVSPMLVSESSNFHSMLLLQLIPNLDTNSLTFRAKKKSRRSLNYPVAYEMYTCTAVDCHEGESFNRPSHSHCLMSSLITCHYLWSRAHCAWYTVAPLMTTMYWSWSDWYSTWLIFKCSWAWNWYHFILIRLAAFELM